MAFTTPRIFCRIAIAGLLGLPTTAHAGGAVARRQQAAQQQRVQIQRQQQIQVQRQIQLHQQMQAQMAVEAVIDIPVRREEASAVATLNDVIASLDVSGRDWALVIDPEIKAVIVNEFIQRYRQEGIIIRQAPEYYAQQIDAMAVGSPEMLQIPFPQILRVAAILGYDFDNGQHPDRLVEQVLGSQSAAAKHKKMMGR